MKNIYQIRQEKNLYYILPDIAEKDGNNRHCKVAVFANLYYIDGIDLYFEKLSALGSCIDIFVISSNDEVLNLAREKKFSIIKKQNRGRDLSAFLVAAKDQILKYEFICFLHDKKKKNEYDTPVLELWIENLLNNAVNSAGYAKNVLNLFYEKTNIGLLVPPEPIGERWQIWGTDLWLSDFENAKKFCTDLNLNCNIDKNYPPITIGSVFWCRVKALKKLFEISWSYEDFPDEPMPDDGTMSHAIERCLGYVAQDAGFDTGTVMCADYAQKQLNFTSGALSRLMPFIKSEHRIVDMNNFNSMISGIQRKNEKRMKIVIFGMGKIFSQYASQIDFSDVVAIVDNNFYKTRTYQYGKYVISPDLLCDYKFDYVVIFNQRNAEDIFNQLRQMGIEGDKIVSWQYYLYFMKRNVKCFSNNCLDCIHNFIAELNIKNILDIDEGLAKNGYFTRYEDFENLTIDDYSLKSSLFKSFYKNSISKVDSCYDALICLDFFINHTISDFLEFIKENIKKTRYIIFSIPYSYPKKFTEWSEYNFSTFGKVQEYNCHTVKFVVIDTKWNEKLCLEEDVVDDDLRILTVTHKKFNLPENDPIYFPIYAGKDDENDMNIPGDATKDNISYLNPLINECTALYWFWKNTDYKYVGLCHYRRYFGDSDGFLNQKKIHDFLNNYDMIVTKAVYLYPLSIKEQLKDTLQKNSFDVGFKLVRSIIEEKYPDYLNDFDEYFDGHILYSCNMFITSRSVLDRYCSWLFDIIIPAAQKIDVSVYDCYSKRVIGFMAERLLTLWILHNGIKVKEVPMIVTENIVLNKN